MGTTATTIVVITSFWGILTTSHPPGHEECLATSHFGAWTTEKICEDNRKMFVENGKTHWLTSKCVENLDIHGERHPLWCKGWPAWPAEEDEDDDRYLGPVDVTQKPIQDPSLLEGVTMHDGYIPKAVLDKFQAELDAKKAAARAARKAAASPK